MNAARWASNVALGPLTTYRVGGAARWLVAAHDTSDLLEIAAQLRGRDVLVVGKGSNLLVCDAGFDGVVVHLGDAFADIEVDPGTSSVRAGGAAFLPVVARRSVAAGLSGFEWAVGVPGSIGGAVRMNAGGHGSEISESLVGVRVVDLRTGEDGTVPAAALHLEYRRSNLQDSQVVIHADLQLAPGDAAAGDATLSEIVRWRREHQPGASTSAALRSRNKGVLARMRSRSRKASRVQAISAAPGLISGLARIGRISGQSCTDINAASCAQYSTSRRGERALSDHAARSSNSRSYGPSRLNTGA